MTPPNCTSCTEAKQLVKPSPVRTDPIYINKDELIHIDLWGKYDITSINGHQYYLLLVDDVTHYVTVYFLKGKHEAAYYVKNYLTHLHTCSTHTHAIHIDCHTEFVNKDLTDWCYKKGMKIQQTVPYSPSPNSVAEWMNCTLIELAHTMIKASQLPEFL